MGIAQTKAITADAYRCHSTTQRHRRQVSRRPDAIQNLLYSVVAEGYSLLNPRQSAEYCQKQRGIYLLTFNI
jgi:hypothetical protein